MFDPLLRVLKDSQLLFVSTILSLSFSVYASDSGPALDNETAVKVQTIDLLVDKTTDANAELVILIPEKGEEASSSQTAGPELVIQSEQQMEIQEAKIQEIEIQEVEIQQAEVQKIEDAATDDLNKTKSVAQPLGPLLSLPKSPDIQKQNLLLRFPSSNFSESKESDSLDFLWQKTFPVDKKSDQENAWVETEKETRATEEDTEESVVLIDDRPTITIIIDDLGYNRRGMEESLALPVEVTLAILPHTPFSKKTANAATEQERTIMLHVPMENERELKLGPGGLYRNMGEAELKQTLKEGIESVPGISGINNHMGSLLTQDVESMKWVMEVIQPMELFFVDSLTSPNSVALAKALKFNLTTTIRDVFLDNVQEEKAIDIQFQRLLSIARKRGKALAIGHPYPSTMSYLSRRLGELESEGIRLVSITDYVEDAN